MSIYIMHDVHPTPSHIDHNIVPATEIDASAAC